MSITGKKRLFEIADRQMGYFTSKQAEECGFSRSNFRLKIQSGEWVKLQRGIYKLAHFPVLDRSELVLWVLWSRGRNKEPQGVWSHATALDIHGLSGIMPSKMHMTVPVGFRRRVGIPKQLQLHFANIPVLDIEERQGYCVTTPRRTLVDIIQEGTISTEHIASAIKDALAKGLVNKREMQEISKWAKSKGLNEVVVIIEKVM